MSVCERLHKYKTMHPSCAHVIDTSCLRATAFWLQPNAVHYRTLTCTALGCFCSKPLSHLGYGSWGHGCAGRCYFPPRTCTRRSRSSVVASGTSGNYSPPLRRLAFHRPAWTHTHISGIIGLHNTTTTTKKKNHIIWTLRTFLRYATCVKINDKRSSKP